MTAVDPARLEKELGRLVESLKDPAELRRRCLDLLEFYADRARRPGASSRSEDAPWVIGVPRPVLRSVSRALRTGVDQNPGLAAPVAKTLWELGYRETQLIAATLLGVLPDSEAADCVEQWSADSRDGLAAAALVREGMTNWRTNHPEAYFQKASEWLSRREQHLQRLGLHALGAAMEEPGFDHLPVVFRMLEGMLGRTKGESRRITIGLIEDLAALSPQETAGFLLDELRREGEAERKLIRKVLDAFPPQQREILRNALSR